MRTLFVFLQEQGGEAVAKSGGGKSLFIMMALIFVVMYFFMIRPQQKRQKELRKFREALQKGDKVVTSGGIYGVIVEIKDNYALVEVDQNVKLRFDKSTILKDMSDATPAK
ncbi:MAG: preprotein translocase subunit YajC [Prevotellaceae bacterium]|jgi:preprotein translocase subunit YajC|nr:preprotein translocase subunit YajC [Prevotellaceae bacterium]